MNNGNNGVFESLYDTNLAKLLYESEIEVLDILYESKILTMSTNGIFTEADTDDTKHSESKINKLIGLIERIVSSIVNTITSAASNIHDMFTKEERIDIYNYLRSETGSVKFEYDLDEVYRSTQESVAKGNKAIRALAKVKRDSAAKVTDDVIRDIEGNFPKKAARVVGFSTAAIVYNKYSKASVFNTLRSDVAAAKNAAKEIVRNDPEKTSDVLKIYGAIATIVNKCMNTINVGMKQVEHEKSMDNKQPIKIK